MPQPMSETETKMPDNPSSTVCNVVRTALGFSKPPGVPAAWANAPKGVLTTTKTHKRRLISANIFELLLDKFDDQIGHFDPFTRHKGQQAVQAGPFACFAFVVRHQQVFFVAPFEAQHNAIAAVACVNR
jgi:hypothetical protein